MILFSPSVQAFKIYFPDEELATESVLPNVDIPGMVLNRNINLRWKVELNVSLGISLDEPFYFKFYPKGQIALNITEFHAVSLSGVSYLPFLSSAGRALKKGEGLGGKVFDVTKAPSPSMNVFLNYRYTPFYGKISLSKAINLNLSIYTFSGLGFIVSKNNDRFPAFNIGIGQKIYINKWLGIKGDLSFYGYYGPAIALLDLSSKELKYGELEGRQKRLNYNILSEIGLIFIL
ncbi:MAG: hypothetical protein GDA46_05885 [Bdellovibrionales bacterium]|nr:hypothetical protein [Bdellovibrionales bacterium]